MNRRPVFVVLTLLMMLALSGCCLKHDMQPATCTAPSTCSKCGKTEGAPLGHTEVTDKAVPPTCTETGLTEGSHCSVCGEVLKAQETIDALGHTEVTDEAVPPTCTETGLTEGIHCSVCGEVLKAQETADALGHTEAADEAVPPTCTETGLTEGSHCSVCGEVLKEQEVIDALGHDWEDATFMKPKTCRRCGEVEGEALGARYLFELLTPDQGTEIAEEKQSAAVQKADAPEKADYLITGNAFGADADSWLSNSSLTYSVDTGDEGLKKYGLSAVINGSEPLHVVFASDTDGIYISLPDLMDGCYYISHEDFLEIAGPYMKNAGLNGESAADMLYQGFSEEDMTALAQKYLDIILSVASVHNSAEELAYYELEGLGENQLALTFTCMPEVSDWRMMLRELLSTARNDDLLMDVLVRAAEISAQNLSQQELLLQFGVKHLEDLRPALQKLLDEAIENVNSYAESLYGTAFEIAAGSDRVYAVKLGLPDGTVYGYESYGDADSLREDGVFSYGDTVSAFALNTLQKNGEGITGKLTVLAPDVISISYVTYRRSDDAVDFDIRLSAEDAVMTAKSSTSQGGRLVQLRYDTEENDFEVNIQKTKREAGLAIDVDHRTVLKNESDIANAAVSIFISSISETDFFLKASELLETLGNPAPAEPASRESQDSFSYGFSKAFSKTSG